MRVKWSEFFGEWDLLLCPPAASTAPLHNHEGDPFERPLLVDGREVPLWNQFFWAGYSGAAYLPSTVAPIGFSAIGLPVGVQIVGPQYGDLNCIRFAQLMERAFGGFVPPPGY
jgi:amidase